MIIIRGQHLRNLRHSGVPGRYSSKEDRDSCLGASSGMKVRVPALVLLLLRVHFSSSIRIASYRISEALGPKMKVSGGLWSRRRPSVVGLVGGIASGKSTVSRVLAESCGVAVIDADKLGHESYRPGTRCFHRLVEEFGTKIVSGDGSIDRRALGEAVFGKPDNMEKLQGIVWPEIRLLAEERIKGLGEQGEEFAVLEAAVLLEAGWDNMCDELWVVQVPPAVARTRLMKRNSLTEEQAEARISSQTITNEERAARASVVISNDGTEEELSGKVKQMWQSRVTVLKARRRKRSLVSVGSIVIAMTVAVTAASIILQRGRLWR